MSLSLLPKSLQDNFAIKVNSSGWLSLPCPFCTEDLRHARHFHLHISPDLSYAHCFRCHWVGTPLEALEALDLKLDLRSFLNGEGVAPPKTTPSHRTVPIHTVDKVKNYLVKRKAYKIALLEKWLFDLKTYAIVIPIYNPLGEELKVYRFLVNSTRRYHVEGERGRFLYNFSLRFRGKPVILCEGVFDCVAVRDAGWQNCFAVLGNKLSSFQVKLLRFLSPSEVYLLFDSEKKDPFIKNTLRDTLNVLERFFPIHILMLPDGDPSSYEDLKGFLEDCKVKRCI